MIISLTGFMGCGKSSVGRRLSELLCCPFMDLDSIIETKAGCSVKEIFDKEGEASFRRMEVMELEDIISSSSYDSTSVLSLGGGTVMTPVCAEMIHNKTCCIYLRASADTLVSNLKNESQGRPLLEKYADNISQRIIELMTERKGIYEKTAHIILDTDSLTVESIARKINSILEENY